MLDQNDLQKIKEIVKETVKESETRVIVAVGEMVEQQILPRLYQLEQEAERIKSQMVTKEYLDKKLAEEFSDFYKRLKREWMDKDVQWKQRVMGILQNAHIASGDDLKELESLIGL